MDNNNIYTYPDCIFEETRNQLKANTAMTLTTITM